MKRVLICGSRTWNKIDVIASVVEKLPSGSVVIQGDARGADTIAKACAELRGLEVMSFPADWEKHGKSAGHRRNKEMLQKGEPNLVIAFIDTLSPSVGTRNMIELAEAVGIQVVKIEMPCPTDVCQTCQEPYSNPPTSRSRICSNPFHCCRECTWEEGKEGGFATLEKTKTCDTCQELYPDDDQDVNKLL